MPFLLPFVFHPVTLRSIQYRVGNGGYNRRFWQPLAYPTPPCPPRRWQKPILDAGADDTKARSLNMARRLFPDIDLQHKCDDGKADALHLARYANATS